MHIKVSKMFFFLKIAQSDIYHDCDNISNVNFTNKNQSYSF